MKAHLIEQNELIAMGPDLLVDVTHYEVAISRLKEQLPSDKPFNPTQVKDILGVSRKYLIPFLESLDQQGWTKRVENERVWV